MKSNEMKKVLSPSILSANFATLGSDIDRAVKAGAPWIHFDVMDGMFVPSISFGMPVLESVRKSTDAFLDVHLMIMDPERYIEEFARKGADSITIHVETVSDPAKAIAAIHAAGCKAGISVKPGTGLETILDVLDQVDMVLIMTVEPGFGGQKYMHEMDEKIRSLAKIREERGLSFDIELDGGINMATLSEALEAGANVLVAGSAVFKGDIEGNVEKMLKVLNA